MRLATLNMAGFTDISLIQREFQRTNLIEADVLFLQELEHHPLSVPHSVHHLAQHIGFAYTYIAEQDVTIGRGRGLGIFSRLPLLDSMFQPLPRIPRFFNERERVALGARIHAHGRTVMMVNVHLDTRISAQERWTQLTPIIDLARDHSGPMIIAGDFNSANVRWLGHLVPIPQGQAQAEVLVERMEELGFHAAQTARQPTSQQFPYCLDWIFARGVRLEGLRFERPVFSDHLAIMVDVIA